MRQKWLRRVAVVSAASLLGVLGATAGGATAALPGARFVF